MNRTLVLAGMGAFATALVMAMIISASIKNKDKTPTRDILVAARDLPVGAKLDTHNTRWQKWPDTASVPGALMRDKAQDDDWKNQKIRRPITQGEPVTTGALVREIKGSYLAAALEPGMRAIAIDVKAASGVAGFLAPGDRVDVILTYRGGRIAASADDVAALAFSRDGMLEKAADTIVENVRVLATDQDAAGNSAGGERKAKVNKTVTLEVTPKQAEKLAVGSDMGELTLSLRQLGDNASLPVDAPATTDLTTGETLRKALQNSGNTPQGRVRVYTPHSVTDMKIAPQKAEEMP